MSFHGFRQHLKTISSTALAIDAALASSQTQPMTAAKVDALRQTARGLLESFDLARADVEAIANTDDTGAPEAA